MVRIQESSIKTIHCTDDFLKYNVSRGDTVYYKGGYYTFDGLSGYKADLKDPINMLRKIPVLDFPAEEPYIGKRFVYNGYEVEVLQQNKNGTYSIQPYKKGKKYGGKFAILKQDLANLKPIQ